jgi:hypothetical protein
MVVYRQIYLELLLETMASDHYYEQWMGKWGRHVPELVDERQNSRGKI